MSAVAEVSDNLPAAPVAAPAAPAAGLPALRQRLGALDRSQRMRLGAGVALLVAVVVGVLKQCGREDLGTLAAVVGLVLGMLLALSMLTDLMRQVQQVFSLY